MASDLKLDSMFRIQTLLLLKKDEAKSGYDIAKELKQGNSKPSGYREQSLKVHGMICAKCDREFDQKDRQLLTVHHKDGNHDNNPADGSNWENLCVYCHDDEHSRNLLGSYYSEGE